MKHSDLDDRYFTTTSYHLACFLYAKECSLVNIDKTDPKQSIFVFANSPELQDLYQAYQFGSDKTDLEQVGIHRMVTSLKFLKERLFARE